MIVIIHKIEVANFLKIILLLLREIKYVQIDWGLAMYFLITCIETE